MTTSVNRTSDASPLRPIRWKGAIDGELQLLDQTLLPGEVRWITIPDVPTLVDAIRRLVVRGAPAIGVAAAYGMVLAMREAGNSGGDWLPTLNRSGDALAASRPTAVNLFWAIGRMRELATRLSIDKADARAAASALLNEAHRVRDEDAAMCRAIGQAGLPLVPRGAGILTHCNAGALATSEYGTALALIYAAQEAGRAPRVFVDETRPLLQGARLTAWELHHAGVEATLICDNMAAVVMREGRVNLVVTGADRIAANGDTANKIGTYGVAVLAKAHDIPFYVAAPSSTFDLSIPDGSHIPIEQRHPDEIRRGFGRDTAPPGIACYNPAFDVTPAALIRGIVTERGVIAPVNAETIRGTLSDRLQPARTSS